jgi:hypothetical protein
MKNPEQVKKLILDILDEIDDWDEVIAFENWLSDWLETAVDNKLTRISKY